MTNAALTAADRAALSALGFARLLSRGSGKVFR
jgi:hypothetical protein